MGDSMLHFEAVQVISRAVIYMFQKSVSVHFGTWFSSSLSLTVWLKLELDAAKTSHNINIFFAAESSFVSYCCWQRFIVSEMQD